MSKKICIKGISCAATCISRGKKCRAPLGEIPSSMIRRLLNLGTEGDERFSDWKEVARGASGKIMISPDGNRAVKLLIPREDGKGGFGPYEVHLGKIMGQLGHSPKIYSSSDKHVEMDFVRGKPIWKEYQKSEGEEPLQAAQARKAAYAFRDLHRLGFFHGDAHALQVLVDGDDVKLVDFGLSGRVSEKPIGVMQDLAKIASLINWRNPDLAGDPYFDLVNKHLTAYRELGKSQSKAAKARKEEIANEYLSELQQLP